MRSLFQLLGLFWILSFSAGAQANGVWVLCDHCQADADFAEVALNAPHQGLVFVSSRNSGATRKFSRLVRWNSATGSWSPEATPRAMSQHEEQVFESTIEGGNTVVSSYPRNTDGLTRWGLGSANSVVEDISNGMVTPTLLQALLNQSLAEGLFPTASELSQSLGFSIAGIISWSGHELGTSRSTVLSSQVVYADGSKLFVTFSRTGEILAVSAVDANGDGLAITFSPSSGARVDPSVLGGWEFGGDSIGAVQALGAWISASGSLHCDWEELSNNRVRVSCRRND